MNIESDRLLHGPEPGLMLRRVNRIHCVHPGAAGMGSFSTGSLHGMVEVMSDGSGPDRMPDRLDTVAESRGFDSPSMLRRGTR